MIDIRNKLESLGFIVKTIKENKINRCATIDKPNKKNGWFRIYDKSVSYGSWDNSIENGYFWLNESDFDKLTEQEKKQQKIERETRQKNLEIEDRKTRLEQINNAYANLLPITPSNAYLARKKCLYRDDFKIDWQRRLVIPMINVKNQLVGYQYISDDGDKKFKTGTILKRGFYAVKPYEVKLSHISLIFLVEGIATALSVYECLNEEYDAIDYAVLACFAASNVDIVANEIYQEIGRKTIIAIKDMDEAGTNVKTQGFSVGLTNGEDANDIHVKYGLETLKNIIVSNLES